jgi:hypothetical protein
MKALQANSWRVLCVLLAATSITLAVKYSDRASAQSRAELNGRDLSLTDRRGVTRTQIGYFGIADEYTYLMLADRNGVTRVTLTVSVDNDMPILAFFDRKGRPLPTARAGMPPPAVPGVILRGSDEITMLQGQIIVLQKQVAEVRTLLNLPPIK